MKNSRHSIRLTNYDYTQSGVYSVTICVKNHSCLFGNIENDNMVLNDAGKMVEKTWCNIPKYYNGYDIDVYQIMPNHIHGIIICVGAGLRARPNVAQLQNINRVNIDVKQNNDSQPIINAGKGRAQGPAPTQ
jgi:REP element-mobilizing transposase RayT